MAEHFHEALDLLRLARHAEESLELSQGHVNVHVVEVELLDEQVQGRHVERILQIACTTIMQILIISELINVVCLVTFFKLNFNFNKKYFFFFLEKIISKFFRSN